MESTINNKIFSDMNAFLKASVITLTVASGVVYYGCNKSNLDLLPHGPTEQSYFTQESDF